jgi:hypothetical protein
MLLLATSLSFVLTACMPAFLEGLTNPTPVIDVAATSAAQEATLAAQTLGALPTATQVPSSTPVIADTLTSTLPPIPSDTPSLTGTPPTATLPVTGTVFTATLAVSGTAASLTASPTHITGTPGTFAAVTASITPTLGIRYYGTIPPLVPSGRVVMINKAHAEAYISFQCINQEGTLSVMEFPVERWREEKIPSGRCKYVAWVGGRQFVGSFTLDTGGQRRIIFYKDRVGIT